jgi:HEAT repeat protein
VEVVAGAAGNDGGEMKLPRRRWVVGVLVVTVLVGAGLLFFGHKNEPKYEGKPVSYWFKEYYSPSHDIEDAEGDIVDSHRVAIKALSAMGSNALLYLVQVAFSTNEDSPSRTNFYNLLAKLPDALHMPKLITQDDIRDASFDAIQKIGPSASDILPLVTSELNGTNVRRRRQAVYILSCVSNNAELVVPYLGKSVHDSDSGVQNIAIAVLADFGPKATPALPDLMDVFEKAPSGDRIRWRVIFALGLIGSNAAPAIPQLREAFEREPDSLKRGALASCLFKIDAGQTYAFDYLIGILTNNPTSRQIDMMASRLAEIGPNAKSSIPALLNALKTTNCDTPATATVLYSLNRLGASNDQVRAALLPKLDSDSNEMREFVLEQINYFDPTGRNETEALIDLIGKHSTNEIWAVVHLGRMGSKGRDAIPLLKQEMNNTNKLLSATAKSALLQIDPGATRN